MAALFRRFGWTMVSGGTRRNVLVASAFNIATTVSGGIAGIAIARSVGAGVRGEYAAIMAWFALVLVIGGFGQSSATTFFVARDPDRATDYVAVSRSMMTVSGAATVVVGMLAASRLGAAGAGMWAYGLMFAACSAALVGVSYVSALQGSSIGRWNIARISQPVCYLIAIVLLHATSHLNLVTALAVLFMTMTAQAVLAYILCVRSQLAGGRPSLRLAGPMARYGAGQLAATIPVVLIYRLDQLVLSLTVDTVELGNYAVAASLTALAVPITAGLGYVAFPRIAAQRARQQSTAQLERRAVGVTACIGLCLMLVVAALAPRLVPAVFGAGYGDAAVLVMILAPGGVFLACQQVCADVLRGHGRPFAVARAQSVAAAFMILLLCVLLPVLGARGAAVASSAATLASFLLLFRALIRAQTDPERRLPIS